MANLQKQLGDTDMMKLGYNTAGTEERFEHWLKQAVENHKCNEYGGTDFFRYAEVGIAEGTTLLAAADLLNRETMFGFLCLGYDLWPSPFFNAQNLLANCAHHCTISRGWMDVDSMTSGVAVGLNVSIGDCGVQLDFALIDACHCATCVERDFMRAYRYIRHNGILAFHDACEEDQGGQPQHGKAQGIDVRSALATLGLLPNSNPYRPGWKFLEEAHGDKARQGNGFIFVQKL